MRAREYLEIAHADRIAVSAQRLEDLAQHLPGMQPCARTRVRTHANARTHTQAHARTRARSHPPRILRVLRVLRVIGVACVTFGCSRVAACASYRRRDSQCLTETGARQHGTLQGAPAREAELDREWCSAAPRAATKRATMQHKSTRACLMHTHNTCGGFNVALPTLAEPVDNCLERIHAGRAVRGATCLVGCRATCHLGASAEQIQCGPTPCTGQCSA